MYTNMNDIRTAIIAADIVYKKRMKEEGIAIRDVVVFSGEELKDTGLDYAYLALLDANEEEVESEQDQDTEIIMLNKYLSNDFSKSLVIEGTDSKYKDVIDKHLTKYVQHRLDNMVGDVTISSFIEDFPAMMEDPELKRFLEMINLQKLIRKNVPAEQMFFGNATLGVLAIPFTVAIIYNDNILPELSKVCEERVRIDKSDPLITEVGKECDLENILGDIVIYSNDDVYILNRNIYNSYTLCNALTGF